MFLWVGIKNQCICDVTNLRNVHLALDPLGVKIECTDYGHILKRASEGDFIYLDPPFSPISKTSNFTEYTTRGFGTKDQGSLLGFSQCYVKGNVRSS